MMYKDQIAQLTYENQALQTDVVLFKARCEQYAEAYEYLLD